jgi:hypothetical protein
MGPGGTHDRSVRNPPPITSIRRRGASEIMVPCSGVPPDNCQIRGIAELFAGAPEKQELFLKEGLIDEIEIPFLPRKLVR